MLASYEAILDRAELMALSGLRDSMEGMGVKIDIFSSSQLADTRGLARYATTRGYRLHHYKRSAWASRSFGNGQAEVTIFWHPRKTKALGD